MSAPRPIPRTGYRGIVAVWAMAAVVAVVIGFVAPSDWRAAWMPVGLAGCMILAFVVQLFGGRAEGFLQRTALSILGAMVVMGAIGLILSLASLLAA